MTEKTSEQSIMDKSMRSVFVGNIPYEATEEKLKEIFSEVGPVLSLKLVFDRESGKPKGYGFCEYKDQETALSAMRNLNGYEIGGRTLRVDNACTEKSRMEMQQLLQGPQVENPYGDHCDADSAPEVITKTVASLPPEQMYELMKQMKACIQNNPSEARQMLLLNPQLAYALLQAQVVMRIVDPASAVTMLHKSNQMPSILNAALMNSQQTSPIISVPQPVPAPQPVPPVGMPVMGSGGYPGATTTQDVDLRPVDPRLNRSLDQDMRVMGPAPAIGVVSGAGSISNNINSGISSNSNDPIGFQQRNQRPPAVNAPFQSDPRQRPVDPRQNKPPVPSNIQQQQLQQPPPAQQQNRIPAGIPNDASDQEKAALIMQVLQLSDEQIAMLPPEQRASILVLKEQIAKSTQR